MAMIIASTVFAPLALAQPRTQEAKDHASAGLAHAEMGKWQDALREYEAAYELDPQPIRLFDVAQTRLKVGRYRAAAEAYAKLEGSPALGPQQQAIVRDGLAEAKSKIARARISVPNARARDLVTIDGATVAREVFVELDPGHHVARLVRDGLATESGIDLDPGGSVTITMVAPTKDAPIAPPPAQEEGSSVPLATWVLGGASVVTLSLGAYFSAVGFAKYKRLDRDPCSDTKTCERIETSSMVTHLVAGDVLLATGVVTAGAAFVWWLLSRPGSQSTKANVGIGTVAISF